MSEKSYKKAGTYYFIGNIFNKGISFLTVPVFTRILSTADYGIVTTYNSWIGILSMIVGFALHMSVRMAAVDYKDKLDDFMSSIILFVTLTSFGITAVVASGIKLLHFDSNIVLVIICMLQAYASATIEDYSNYLMMKYEYKARTALMILPNFISVVLSVYMIKYVLESDLYMGRIIPTAVVTIFFGLVTVCLTLKNLYVITVNFVLQDMTSNASFISNEKRLASVYTNIDEKRLNLITSNLQDEFKTKALVFDYSSLLGEGDCADNAGAMLIRILKKCDVRKIYLAGFDGFDVDTSMNYFVTDFKTAMDYDAVRKKNDDISKQLKLALSEVKYELLTPSKYEI